MQGLTDAPSTRALTAGLLLAMTLHAVHGLAVVAVLPVVAEDLDGRSLYGASMAAYLLASLVGLVGAGAWVDRIGPAPPFAAGLGLFGVGLVGSGAAPSMLAFTLARVVEGAGGGMASAVLYASVNLAYPASRRPQILAWLSGAWVLPGLLAPPLAAVVAEALGWRWVFFGLLPGVLLAGALALPALRGSAPATAEPQRGAGVPQALALAAGVGLLLAALNGGVSTRSAIGVATGLGLSLPALQRLLPRGTLRARPVLPAAIASKLLLTGAFFGADAFLPLALTEVRGAALVVAGLILTVGSLTWTAGAFLHARRADRDASGAVALAAAAAILAGTILVGATLAPAVPLATAFLGWGVAGVGMGLGSNALNVTAMGATQAGREGATATALGIADALGVALATGIGGAVLAQAARASWPTAQALALVWALAAAVACLAGLTAMRLPLRVRRPERDTPNTQPPR
jgi:MFS family permease